MLALVAAGIALMPRLAANPLPDGVTLYPIKLGPQSRTKGAAL